MTTEEILKLAREAGFDVHPRKGEIRAHPDVSGMMIIDLTEAVNKLVGLVAAAEREECAKICDEECRTAFAYSFPDALAALEDAAKLIRARKELIS